MKRGGDLIDVSRIAGMLAVRAADLAYELLPNGQRDGREWECGNLAGKPGRSLKVHIAPDARQGVWCDFKTGQTGDALDLVAEVLYRGDKRAAISWAKAWLGLGDGDPGKLRTYRRAVEGHNKRAADDEADEAKRAELARRMFAGARAGGIVGTLAETYLKARGIDLRAFGRAPGALAFSAQCWCRERQAKRPAMLAAITRGARIVAVHRTYLTAAGAKDSELRDPKLTLGRYRGGFIPLWRPEASPRWSALWRDDGPGETIVVAEGIENALSVAVADPTRRVAASVSLANMAALELPPLVREVIVAADNDARDSKAADGLDRAIAALKAKGLAVAVARAPAPHKDFNDWLQALTRAKSEAAA